jgi:hypothetical protein
VPVLLALLLLAAPDWQPLAAGVDYRRVQLAPASVDGDGQADVVRLDPKVAHLELALASEHGGTQRTAAEWAEQEQFVAVINAGMYGQDQLTNVGHLHHVAHVNQKAWKGTYQSLALQPPTSAASSARSATAYVAGPGRACCRRMKTVVRPSEAAVWQS